MSHWNIVFCQAATMKDPKNTKYNLEIPNKSNIQQSSLLGFHPSSFQFWAASHDLEGKKGDKTL